MVHVLVLFAAFLLGGPALAENYPSHPARLLVGFPPGGATDLVARIVQPRLSQALGREVIVDNRPGANGVVAAELTAKSPPDGYTVHLATLASLVISPAISSVPYDPARDFTPLGRAVELQNIFLAHPSLPVRSLRELVAYARAHPGVLNYATSGTGSTGHLSAELLTRLAGIDWVHVPYKGGGPALTDFLSGQVQVFVAVISTAVPYVKQGKVNALAVTGSHRTEALAAIPTAAESGFSGYESTNWYAFVAPAGLPAAIAARWEREIRVVLSDLSIRRQLAERGIDAAPSSAAELAAHLQSETRKWAPLAQSLGLQAN
ncbi:MAG: tripartite tricarboxylate transporter substrate binding protein [Betaproteobacteria bacterium]|nr:tripartite tricarboxylate transporter substrate binding protein [Betaproteobacteria bacterium]